MKAVLSMRDMMREGMKTTGKAVAMRDIET